MRSTILASAAILGSIVLGVLLIRAYKQVVVENADRDIINATQKQYGDALSRWRSHRVIEYDITVSKGRELWSLRFNEQEGTAYLLKHEKNGIADYAPGLSSLAEYDSYADFTVGALFDTAQQYITDGSAGTLRQIASSDGFIYSSEYDVRFDTTLGYPTHLIEYQRATRPSREITWRVELPSSLEVNSLTIVR